MFSSESQPPIPVVTNSEHRKKMAAAKDIWSSDSEAEDEKYLYLLWYVQIVLFFL